MAGKVFLYRLRIGIGVAITAKMSASGIGSDVAGKVAGALIARRRESRKI